VWKLNLHLSKSLSLIYASVKKLHYFAQQIGLKLMKGEP
jgi:hypothetical protein